MEKQRNTINENEIREDIRSQICQIIQNLVPTLPKNISQENLIQLSSFFEERLYREAKSVSEYCDLTTLEKRVQAHANILERRVKSRISSKEDKHKKLRAAHQRNCHGSLALKEKLGLEMYEEINHLVTLIMNIRRVGYWNYVSSQHQQGHEKCSMCNPGSCGGGSIPSPLLDIYLHTRLVDQVSAAKSSSSKAVVDNVNWCDLIIDAKQKLADFQKWKEEANLHR